MPKVSTELNKQVDTSQANSNYDINFNERYSCYNDDSIDLDSINAKIIANISIQNVSRDKASRHGKLSNSTNKNSTIEFDYTVSKEQTSQAISQELLDSSSEITGFVDYLHIRANHYELQTQVYLSSNGNLQFKTLFEKSEYTNDSETTPYRTNSPPITNTNSRDLNTV